MDYQSKQYSDRVVHISATLVFLMLIKLRAHLFSGHGIALDLPSIQAP